MIKQTFTVCRYLLHSIFFTSFLIPKSNAQETFTVTPEQTKQILNTYGAKSVLIHPVILQEVNERQSYIFQDSLVNLDKFSGTFIQYPNKYFLVLGDPKGKFVKNEVLDETDSNNKAIRNGSSYYLIQRKDSQQFYYVMSDVYLSNLKQSQSNQEILDLVHKLGYKEYKDGEDLYIKSKTSEIKLDKKTYDELKKNPSYISQLDADQTKIASLVKQTVPHSKALDKFLSTYNIKRSKMPVSELNAWRNATTNAQKLNSQIYKLTEKYEDNYSYRLLNKSNTLDTFLDNLNASKGVLGM